MSKIDEKLEELGYKVTRTLRKQDNNKPDRKTEIVFLEYRSDISEVLWSDNNRANLDGTTIVQLFCYDLTKGYFAMRSDYEKNVEDGSTAYGGDREYGTILRGIPEHELRVFTKKMRQLKRQYRCLRAFNKIFRRR